MFIFSHLIHFQGIQVRFICEGDWAKVKVTGAKNVENPYSSNVKLQLAITLLLSQCTLV